MDRRLRRRARSDRGLVADKPTSRTYVARRPVSIPSGAVSSGRQLERSYGRAGDCRGRNATLTVRECAARTRPRRSPAEGARRPNERGRRGRCRSTRTVRRRSAMPVRTAHVSGARRCAGKAEAVLTPNRRSLSIDRVARPAEAGQATRAFEVARASAITVIRSKQGQAMSPHNDLAREEGRRV